MKLWLLKPIKNWTPVYDCTFGVVVRADSEGRARALASKEAGDEGQTSWMDKRLTTCSELTADGAEEVVLRDFNAG